MSSAITFNDATYRYIISADIMNPRNNDAIIFKGLPNDACVWRPLKSGAISHGD